MKPSTDWRETIPADEPQRFQRLTEQLRGLQKWQARGGPAGRTFHDKTTAGVEAEFTVLPDLPEHARAGLFASPTSYRAYVRISNGSGRPQSDAKGDVRGLAVKLLGVPGTKLIPGQESATTQDFLLIQSPDTPFRDAEEFVALACAAEGPLALLRAIATCGPLRAAEILWSFTRGVKRPVASIATSRYWSALPIKFGAYAVHFALTPRTPTDPWQKPGTTYDYLADELAERLARGPVEYDFQVQFYVDPKRTPIEDGSVEWQEHDAPFLTIARLTLLQQDMKSPRGERLKRFIDTLSFDPWHAQEELRPIGNLMRARGPAYRMSKQGRGAAPEPDGTERFDDAAERRAGPAGQPIDDAH